MFVAKQSLAHGQRTPQVKPLRESTDEAVQKNSFGECD